MRRLTLRDLAATACFAGAVIIFALQQSLTSGPLDGARLAGLLIFLFGLMSCSANGQQVNEGGYARAMSIAGKVTFGLFIVVLITGNQVLLDLMFGVIALMWLVTTVRHAMGKHLAERPVYATSRSAWRM